MRPSSFEKIAFVGSLLVLAFLYGIASQAFDWFPSSYVLRAWNQAEAVSPLSAEWFTAPSWTTSQVYSRKGVTVTDSAAIQPGLTLIESHWKRLGWSKGLRLIDHQGRTVHQWRVPAAELFPNPPRAHVRTNPSNRIIHGSHLFPNGDVLVNIEYVGTVRLDACGNVEWKLAEGSHHSISQADDETFWISAQSFEPPGDDRSSQGDLYLGINPVQWDRIIHISEDGDILEDYRVLNILFNNNLEKHIPATSWHNADEIDTTDITHLNDVEPLSRAISDEYPMFSTGDLLVSLNHLDLVIVFDPDTGQVIWHISDPSLIGPHDPDFLGDGWIGVFDNRRDGTERGQMLGGSRVIAFQPHTDSTRVLFQSDRSESFHTDTQGLWQRLENGNLLLTETQAGRVVEVTAGGRTVWDWVTDPYSQQRIPEVSGAERYDLPLSRVETWPCSTGDTNEAGAL